MNTKIYFIIGGCIAIFVVALLGDAYYFHPATTPKLGLPPAASPQIKTNLSPEQYKILFEGGTEQPYTSPLLDEHRKGTFVTADTGEPVFRSEDKYDSGTGWPSFTKPIEGSVILQEDDSLGMQRTEVVSKDTHAHLGHVFDDGPPPAGKRYCMNGLALTFIPDENQETPAPTPEEN